MKHCFILQAGTGAKKPGIAGLQLGSNIPDFMELSAPAVLPQEMCPSWMPEDSWVSVWLVPLLLFCALSLCVLAL